MKRIILIAVLFFTLALPGASAGAQILANVPDYEFWYGHAPTSAGMMMGYYDINGYGGLRYDNLVPGGTAELNTFTGSGWSALANNIIASSGHVTDFYAGGYGAAGDDRTPPPPLHTFNSLSDFMGSNQDSVGNVNGRTTFYYWTNGAKFTAQDALTYGLWNSDGMYGILEYLKYAGYDAAQLYTQRIYSANAPYGFTFSDYMAEINAGRVVLIQAEGSTFLGYGYDAQTNLIYLNDTWSTDPHTMTWGGDYYGMGQWGVLVLEPSGGTSAVPEPATMLLFGFGLVGLAGVRRIK